MTYSQIMQSFLAFNINAFNNLLYITKTNLWIILTIIGAIAIVVMNVMEEVEDYVTGLELSFRCVPKLSCATFLYMYI